MSKTHTYNMTNEFDQLCQEIYSSTPINFCSFGRIYKNATYSCFMSNPTWVNHYKKNYYDSTLPLWIENIVKQSKSGFDIWSLSSFFNTNHETKIFFDDCRAFNYTNGINIITTFDDYYEVCSFATPKIDGIDRIFLEKHNHLLKLSLMMKDNILRNKMMVKELDNRCYIPEYPIIANNHFDRMPQTIDKFYLGYPLKENHHLTQRELDCLLPMLLFIPTKLISKKINLSTRTIEAYLHNILMKTHDTDLKTCKRKFVLNKYIQSMLPDVMRKYA